VGVMTLEMYFKGEPYDGIKHRPPRDTILCLAIVC